jgi:hypothetical protein
MKINPDWTLICNEFLGQALSDRSLHPYQLMRMCVEYEESDFDVFSSAAIEFKRERTLSYIQDIKNKWKNGEMGSELYSHFHRYILDSLDEGRRETGRRSIREFLQKEFDCFQLEEACTGVAHCMKVASAQSEALDFLRVASRHSLDHCNPDVTL